MSAGACQIEPGVMNLGLPRHWPHGSPPCNSLRVPVTWCVLWRIQAYVLSVGDVWLGLLPALSLIKDYASPILGFEKHVS